MAMPLVMNAWYHAGAADVALELITNLEAPDQRGLLATLVAAPPDLLDWTAFSLGTRSASSTLDLCAAAAWRLSDGPPLKGDREQDLDQAFRDRAQLAASPLRDWLVSAHESAEYRPDPGVPARVHPPAREPARQGDLGRWSLRIRVRGCRLPADRHRPSPHCGAVRPRAVLRLLRSGHRAVQALAAGLVR
jgi:hypothetical protein